MFATAASEYHDIKSQKGKVFVMWKNKKNPFWLLVCTKKRQNLTKNVVTGQPPPQPKGSMEG